MSRDTVTIQRLLWGVPVFLTTYSLSDHLWPAGPGVLWACFLDYIAEIVLLRCAFKTRWILLGLVLRPDEGRDWPNCRCILVLLHERLPVELFLNIHITPGSHPRYKTYLLNDLNWNHHVTWSFSRQVPSDAVSLLGLPGSFWKQCTAINVFKGFLQFRVNIRNNSGIYCIRRHSNKEWGSRKVIYRKVIYLEIKFSFVLDGERPALSCVEDHRTEVYVWARVDGILAEQTAHLSWKV